MTRRPTAAGGGARSPPQTPLLPTQPSPPTRPPPNAPLAKPEPPLEMALDGLVIVTDGEKCAEYAIDLYHRLNSRGAAALVWLSPVLCRSPMYVHGIVKSEHEDGQVSYTELHGVTRSCTELPGVTRSYTELHGATRSFTELHGVTRSYT